MEISIKHMVCRHCVAAVERAISSVGLTAECVEIGRAVIKEEPGKEQLEALDDALRSEGFERISNSSEALVERAKIAVRHHARSQNECRLKLSACIESQLGVNFDTVSRLFSHCEGRTIEQYNILQRVEYVKELLAYGERTLDEIADLCGYSGAAHLSRQFKSVTGMTPGQYRRSMPERTPLSDV